MRIRMPMVLLLSAGLIACASSQPKNDFELTIGDGNLALELSRDVVFEMLEYGLEADLQCDGDLDRELRTMLERLDRRRSSTATMGEGGDRVVATRRGSRLTFVVGRRGGGHLEATLPWAVADCLLGKRTSLEKALGKKPIVVKLVTSDGETFSAKLR